MSKRKFVPIRKLGSTRVDLPLGKKKEYIRRIITLKQPYKVVRKIYLEEFQKDLSYSTFSTWKKNGGKLLEPDFRGVNCRASFKKCDVIDRFEEKVMEVVQNSKYDIEGCSGLTLECQKMQKNDLFKNEDEIQNLQFSRHYVHRLLRRFFGKITRGKSTQVALTPEEDELERARLTSERVSKDFLLCR